MIGAVGLIASVAQATYVTPKIGGGQTAASMKHTDVGLNTDDPNNPFIELTVDTTVPTPVLRPITPPAEWDPTQPWSVLGYQAYNYQWAWNPAGVIPLDPNYAICVERVHQDPAMKVYLRPPMYNPSDPNTPKWPEIFTADGSRWKWTGAMQHNAYAVCGPYQTEYSATYSVYVGDATTLEPIPGYGSATVTWIWNATLAGDMNCDGVLDGNDAQAFAAALIDQTTYQAAYPTCRYYDADCNCDGLVDLNDIPLFMDRLLTP
jgi:hypothetical protein